MAHRSNEDVSADMLDDASAEAIGGTPKGEEFRCLRILFD
jgi:hypothetical protein